MEAIAVVPLPMNGSKTIACSRVNNLINCSMSSTGFTDKCVLKLPFSWNLFKVERWIWFLTIWKETQVFYSLSSLSSVLSFSKSSSDSSTM